MKPIILLVEDNENILFNVKLLLELNDYATWTASNGQEALDLLQSNQEIPDLILSDIMMPVMDGYSLYQKISENPLWTLIPFIFLSAKSDPEDVRFGKMLGVDDYITKPFNEEDLLACIVGKIKKSKKNKLLSTQIEAKLLEATKNLQSPLPQARLKDIYFLELIWDDIAGPKLVHCYPDLKDIPFTLENIGEQLFNTSVGLYGYEKFYDPQGILLKIANIGMDGYVLFDTYENSEMRGGRSLFMLGIISPRINYFESLRIKEILTDISKLIKLNKPWKFTDFLENIHEIFVF